MLNNLTNFFSILAKKRYKSTPEDTDLVALGTKDRTFQGGYKPVATRLEDLKSYFASSGGSISLTTLGTSGPSTLIGNTLNIPNYAIGVQSVTGLNTDNTDPLNPVIELSVDGVTITGDGTPGNPLVGSPAGVVSVTGLDTDNTDPLNPIINIAVDGATVTGDGTPGNPLVANAGSSGSVQVATNQVVFDDNYIYYTSGTPTTGNITEDLTGAKLGLVQKIYHNDAVPPSFPAGWVLIGTGTYSAGALNIIYAEWAGGTRVEYWIVQ